MKQSLKPSFRRSLLFLGAAAMASVGTAEPLFTATAPDGLSTDLPKTAEIATTIWEAPEPKTPPPAPNCDRVRNVIYIIGDGMGFGSIRLAALRTYGTETSLFLEKLPHAGVVRTCSANSRVTDSAASGTALASGHKTNNSHVGVDPKRNPLKSIATLAKERNLAVGILTDDYLAGATPAAFYAHQRDRNMGDEILSDLPKSGFDIFLANDNGSAPLYNNRTLNGLNIVKDLQSKGYAFAQSPEAFVTTAKTGSKLLCVIPKDDFYKLPPVQYKDLMEAALANLSQNPNGFFMMFESCFPDKGGHGSDMHKSVLGTIRTDWLVKAAVDFASTHPGTLVLVTADHETGGLYPVRGSDDANPVVYTTAQSHTEAPVPIHAYGPGSELFHGCIDNTDIPKIIASLLFPDTKGQL